MVGFCNKSVTLLQITDFLPIPGATAFFIETIRQKVETLRVRRLQSFRLLAGVYQTTNSEFLQKLYSMKYVFVIPQFLAEFYFCNHDGQGFKLTSRIEDALTSSDPESATREAARLQLQSGYAVHTRQVLINDRVRN